MNSEYSRSTWSTEQEPVSKTNQEQQGIVTYLCDPSPWELESGRSRKSSDPVSIC